MPGGWNYVGSMQNRMLKRVGQDSSTGRIVLARVSSASARKTFGTDFGSKQKAELLEEYFIGWYVQ